MYTTRIVYRLNCNEEVTPSARGSMVDNTIAARPATHVSLCFVQLLASIGV